MAVSCQLAVWYTASATINIELNKTVFRIIISVIKNGDKTSFEEFFLSYTEVITPNTAEVAYPEAEIWEQRLAVF